MISHIQKFRTALAEGKVCLGAGISFSDPAVTEALCDSVDFLWIDLEHTPISLESLMAHLIAARAGGAPALVRVPVNDVAWIKRVLDIGAEGIIVPQVQNADDVRQAVRACRYAPLGARGMGPRRPSNYGRDGGDDFRRRSNEQIFVAVQIETVEAYEDLDRIVAVEGLDSLAIGPYDLSSSFGIIGQVDDPRIAEAISTIASKARGAGLYVGIGVSASADMAARFVGLGVQWLQVGCDFSYLVNGADDLFRSVRGRVE